MTDDAQTSKPPPGSLHQVAGPPACACVSHDAVMCAAKRDDLDCDDPRYEVRRCDCACHDDDYACHDDD